MTEYTHFEDSRVASDGGLYVGVKGSEVQVADSTGALSQAGTSVPSYPTGHVTTASKLVAFGTATLDDVKTIATGLTTVAAGVAVRASNQAAPTPAASSIDPVIFNCHGTSGNLVIRGYGIASRAANSEPVYLVATGTSCSIDWIAWGV